MSNQLNNNNSNSTLNNVPMQPFIDESFINNTNDNNQESLSENESTTGDKQPKKRPANRSGRRKINIEFIEDKNKRHITFSKRKSGIMKKAFELSTLTGTQILLLVVSETGLVYTFTTPKLQPLVTKQEGKNLIQSCLNSETTSTTVLDSNRNENSIAETKKKPQKKKQQVIKTVQSKLKKNNNPQMSQFSQHQQPSQINIGISETQGPLKQSEQDQIFHSFQPSTQTQLNEMNNSSNMFTQTPFGVDFVRQAQQQQTADAPRVQPPTNNHPNFWSTSLQSLPSNNNSNNPRLNNNNSNPLLKPSYLKTEGNNNGTPHQNSGQEFANN